MIFALSAILAVVLVECIMRLPIRSSIYLMATAGSKALRTITSKHISDHWKERVLLRYALDIARGSVLIILCLLIIVCVVFAASWLSSAAGVVNLVDFLFTWQGLILITLVACAYAFARKRLSGS